MKRNPRRAYDADGRMIEPPTVGSLRLEGETTAAVDCRACGRSAVISTDRLPADLPFPDIVLRIRCSGCGSRTIGVMRDMLAYYVRSGQHGCGVGPAMGLPAHYQVVGRDVPWPDRGLTPKKTDPGSMPLQAEAGPGCMD